MRCPLCATELKQHLIQPSVALISCPATNCVYPLNMSVRELHDHNLILNVSTQDILHGVQAKMHDAGVNPRIAAFITKEDDCSQ